MIYGNGAYCNFYDTEDEFEDGYKAVRKMSKIWEQALLRRIGSNKAVNAKRIMILYTDKDYECIYPAQAFKVKDDSTFAKKRALLLRVLSPSNER